MFGKFGEAVNLVLDRVSDFMVPDEAFMHMEWQDEEI